MKNIYDYTYTYNQKDNKLLFYTINYFHMADEITFDTQSYSILSLIAKNPEIKKSDIIEKMKGIGSQTKITNIITEMIERKIIIEIKHGRYNLKTYELIPYGEKVYAARYTLYRTIEGDDPRSEEDSVSTPSSNFQYQVKD